MDQPPNEIVEPRPPVRWRRSEQGTLTARSLDPKGPALPFPGNEIERILKEYACECYAVGRGESMYYLVEDLPKIAKHATQEILAIQPDSAQSIPKPPKTLPRSVAPLTGATSPFRRKLPLPRQKASIVKGVKSVIAVLPIVALLAVIGITIGLTFREFVGG